MILGVGVDAEGRCAHWHEPTDVVALRLACCDAWYACRACHDATAGHVGAPWPAEPAVAVALCGACGGEMLASEYLAADACPACLHSFNPGCRLHRALYFAF